MLEGKCAQSVLLSLLLLLFLDFLYKYAANYCHYYYYYFCVKLRDDSLAHATP